MQRLARIHKRTGKTYATATTNERGLKLQEFATYNKLGLASITTSSITFCCNSNSTDIGSDHDLVMKNFRLRLKKIIKPKQTSMNFNYKKLKDPKITEAFQALIGGKFTPLTILEEENTDIETLTNNFNNVVTDTASVMILSKHSHKKHWITTKLLDMCDKMKSIEKGEEQPQRSRYI